MSGPSKKEKVKVCVTGLRGVPDIMGGIETHCENLCPRLAALDNELDIVILARSPYAPADRYEWQGVTVQSIWTIRNKYLETILHTAISIFYARFWEKASIIHIHAIGPGLLTPLAKIFGLKVLMTHHGHDYDRQKWNGFAKAILRLGENFSTLFADQVIMVSPSGAKNMAKRFPKKAEAIHFVPNAAALPIATEGCSDPLKELGIEAGRYILCVGRLVPEKRFDDVIAAHNNAPQAAPLVIVGDADHDDDFSRSLKEKASDRVIFAGRRNREALVQLYKQCGLFVLPSSHEGLPISALEAMSVGAPLLLSDIQPNLDIGLPETCYFPLGDRAVLSTLLQSCDYGVFRVDNQALKDRYDWRHIAVRTHQLISELKPGEVRPATAIA